MVKKWKLLKSEAVFETPFITILREELERPDGRIVSDFYAVKRRDAVFIAALTEDKKIPLVYQYKNGVKDLIWELPAGFVDAGETPDQAAVRELSEETGYSCQSYQSLGSFTPNPSVAENKFFVFLGNQAKKTSEQRLDGNEDIEVKLYDLEELVTSVKKRQSIFIDTLSQLALLLIWEELNK